MENKQDKNLELKSLIVRTGLTIKDFAGLVHSTPQTIRNAIQGTGQTVSLKLKFRIVATLNLKLREANQLAKDKSYSIYDIFPETEKYDPALLKK